MSPLEKAPEYIGRGWRVLPLSRGDKRPLTAHGVRDASSDLRQLERWQSTYPEANLGIACGEPSGLVVLDIDLRNGGQETLDTLRAKHGVLPVTLTSRTGNGMHFYFQHSGPFPSGVLGSGVDLLANGRYAVAPPSIHPSGQRYEWVSANQEIAPLPEWIAQRNERAQAQVRGGASADLVSLGLSDEQIKLTVEGVPRGQRSEAIFKVIRVLIARGHPDEIIEAVLLDPAHGISEKPMEKGSAWLRGEILRARNKSMPLSKPSAVVRVELVSGADVRPEPIKWLWPGWLAAGKLQIIAGAPEAGKTSIALALAATITVGGAWPDRTRAQLGTVVIWSGEDSIEDVLTPRLIALGADMSRIRFVRRVEDWHGKRPFDPAHDLAALQDALAGRDVTLLIVDPIVSAVTGESHENAKVRRALQPIVDLAESVKCAVLGISHFSKGTAGRDPVERVTGSVAFGALPRIVFAAAKLPDDEGGSRIFVRAKNNIGLSGGGYSYSIQQHEIADSIETSRLVWGTTLAGNARALLAKAEATGKDQGAIAEAKEFLQERLAAGPAPANQIKRESGDIGYKWRTVQEAARRLAVRRRKGGMSEGWIWELPDAPKMHSDAKMHEGAHLESLHLCASSEKPAPCELVQDSMSPARGSPAEVQAPAPPTCASAEDGSDEGT